MRSHSHRRGLYSPELLESRIAPATIVVTSLLDNGDGDKITLREAIEIANDQTTNLGADTITFDPAILPGTITLNGTDLTVTDTLTIKGPGVDRLGISGGGNSRILDINDQDTATFHPAVISGLTLFNGVSGFGGGALASVEPLTLKDMIIRGNSAQLKGGGIFVETDGKVSFTNVKLVANTNTGGVGGGAFVSAGSGFSIVKSLFSGNTTDGAGGGLYARAGAEGKALIDHTAFIGNASTGASGGGLALVGSDSRPVIKNSVITGNTADAQGGGLFAKVGVLTLLKSSVTNNTADFGGGLAASQSLLTVSGTTFFDNRATDATKAGGGAIYLHGGATGQSSITASTFGGNASASGGGAITVTGKAAELANLLIKSSSLLGNTAATTGGGINFVPDAGETLAGSVVTLTKSVVSGNAATGGAGGGVYATGGGAVVVNGGKFEGNFADTYGGGLATLGSGAKGVKLDVIGTLFTGNSAANGGGVHTQGGGQVTVVKAKLVGNLARATYGGGMDLSSTSGISVSGTLFERNHAANDGGGLVIRAIGAATWLVSGSQFLGNTAGGDGGGLVVFGDISGQVLKSVLSGNVAATKGGGLANFTPDSVDLAGTKLTGNFAPVGANLYGGAANVTAFTPAAGGGIVVTSLADDGGGALTTLREAIEQANAHPGKDAISFDPTLFSVGSLGTITLNGTDLDITGPLVIKGPGVEFLAISGNNASRIFNINDGNFAVDSPVAISGLTLTGGKAVTADLGGRGGAIRSAESLSLERTVVTGNTAEGDGGGVYLSGNTEKLTIKSSVFTRNTAGEQGGGIDAKTLAGVLISKSILSGNQAKFGGGLYSDNYDSGKAVVVDSTVIVANLATEGGGGIQFDDNLVALPNVIKNSVISGNTANVQGGGIFVSGDGQLKLSKSVVSNNAAPVGGGLADQGAALTISSTAFLANRATDAAKAGGGGLYLKEMPLVSIESSLFAGNTSAAAGGAITATGKASNPVNLTVKSSRVLGNTAATVGGGVAFLPEAGENLAGSFVNLTGSIVSGNVASTGGGGGIAAQDGGTLTVKGGAFVGNRAGGAGGGILTTGAGDGTVDLTVAGTLFQGNTGTRGGAIDTDGDGTIEITGAKFVANLALTNDGGALYLRSNGFVSVVGSLFQGNRAKNNGGGLAINGLSVLVTTSKFFDNTSGIGGGGITIFGTEAGAVTKSLLTGNIAGVSGGAIGNLTADPLDISGSKIFGNFAPTAPNIFGPVLPP